MGKLGKEERGATYLFVMLAVVLMGISATVVAQQWKAVVQRDQEAELLARGIEIQNAIAAYSGQQKKGRVMPGEIYPLTLEELTKQPKPVLRKAYQDPITGGDWEYVRDPATSRIKGVKSKSTAKPFKEHDFPPALRHFEGLTSYSAWVFQFPNAATPQTPQAAPVVPGTPGAPGTTPTTPTPAAPATPPVPTVPTPPAITPPPAGM
jgi:type II secretory pathway pseudopilin PulG